MLNVEELEGQVFPELIDTQWDVNEIDGGLGLCPNLELIDTQWDVNYLIGDGTGFVDDELIDTQWDVNIS